MHIMVFYCVHNFYGSMLIIIIMIGYPDNYDVSLEQESLDLMLLQNYRSDHLVH